jgi:flagellar hook-associated protein 1 FlgK
MADGRVSNFAGPMPVTVDGLQFQVSSGAAAVGDTFLIKPFGDAASTLQMAFTSARALAVANPVEVRTGTGNTGGAAVTALRATAPDANLTQPVTITFTGPGTFNVTGTGTGNPTGLSYVPGQEISFNGWSLTLKGVPANGDSMVVQAATSGFAARNAGNADALMALRDKAVFDGAPLSDGYASLMAQVGVRTQSAGYAAEISAAIASNAESDRAGVAGVNLDEEAAKLIQFQQAYQASSKMIQIAQNIFDQLIQGLS